ncbi:MAG: hypothetical protein CL763_03970 [Chloroflexi bacterium]|nr:hypothetical protein [Chloroflexota bacterium]|tara:strand:- start:11783 stop:12106 length:324 start_codon:yes stop_codon:yes gene_type:complete
MPIYSYYCDSCDVEFDLRQGFDAGKEARCASCGNPAKRKFVAPTVIYKGSGFYTTDYARKSGGSTSSTSPPKSTSPSDQAAAAKDPGSGSKNSESTNQSSKSTTDAN